jgi:hypothetical protein
MGKIVMSLSLLSMLAGTTLLMAAPALVKSDYAAPLAANQICLLRGVGCSR